MRQFWQLEPGVKEALAVGERIGAPWAALLLAAFFGVTAALDPGLGARALAFGPCAVCLCLWLLWRRPVAWPTGFPLLALAGVVFGSTLFRIAIQQYSWGATRLAIALVGASLIAPTPGTLVAVIAGALGVWGVGLVVTGPPEIGWAYSSIGLAFAAVLALLAYQLRVRMVRDLLASRDAFERSDAHLRRAQKLAGLGSWEWDLERRTITWSDEVDRILGRRSGSPRPTLEEFVEQMIHPDDRVASLELIELCRRAEGAFEREFRLVRPDGSLCWVESQGVSMRDADGRPVMVGTLLDRTAQREGRVRERELLRALARRGSASMLGEVAAVLAHELRHPVAAIGNFAAGGLRHLESGATAEVAEALHAIGQEAERATDTIRAVTQAARREPVPLKPVELVEVAQRVARLLDFETRELGVAIRVQAEHSSTRALANSIQVAQVFGNLLRNAVEAIAESSKAGGEVRVAIGAGEPGWIEVSVHDTGKGISSDRAEAIFAPFFTTKRAGTGLGLAVSRRLVESFGGRLWLAPEAEGATFRFTLPRAEASELVH